MQPARTRKAAAGEGVRLLQRPMSEYERVEGAELLGSGGYGTVLQVRHRKTGVVCAAKIVSLDELIDQMRAPSEVDHRGTILVPAASSLAAIGADSGSKD